MKVKIKELAIDIGISLLVFLIISITCMLTSSNAEDFSYVAF